MTRKQQDTPYECGKRHATIGIMFYSEGQRGWRNCREYARGYLNGVPYGSEPAATKAEYLVVAQRIAGVN